MAAIKPTGALLAPITNRAQAEAFMRELVRLGLDFHFDDGAEDCLFGNGRVTLEDAKAIDRQVARCYEAWEASGADLQHDCPIGYLLDYERYAEALHIARSEMPGRALLPAALRRAATACEIKEGPRTESFVAWALNQTTEGE